MKEHSRCVEQVEAEAKVKAEQGARALRVIRNLSLLVLTGWLGYQFPATVGEIAWADSSSSPSNAKLKGNVGRGREIFNGKGSCYYCHGIDGYLGRTPRLEADTAALIAELNPPPPDLRNPGALRLNTNKERARAVREGHPGTGMFPDLTMTDQDLADTLMYLALLRRDPNPMAD
ncbi:MAG: hypothetical protein OEY86_07000 [Nitrospira sp.]|nr:hypothetical protein [Nitrospira sp.]